MPNDYEAAAEFLGRQDFTIDELADQSQFERKLIDIFGRGGKALPTDRQTEEFFRIMDVRSTEFPDALINRVEFVRGGKLQTRFTLPNFRGLFSFTSALKFLRGG